MATRAKRKATAAQVPAAVEEAVVDAGEEELFPVAFHPDDGESSEESVYSGLEEEEESSSSDGGSGEEADAHARVLFGDNEDGASSADERVNSMVEPPRRVVRRKRSSTLPKPGGVAVTGESLDEDSRPAQAALPGLTAAPATEGAPMVVETSESDTTDDEHSRNTLGKIPSHWYDDEEHAGYDLDGKKVRPDYRRWRPR